MSVLHDLLAEQRETNKLLRGIAKSLYKLANPLVCAPSAVRQESIRPGAIVYVDDMTEGFRPKED